MSSGNSLRNPGNPAVIEIVDATIASPRRSRISNNNNSANNNNHINISNSKNNNNDNNHPTSSRRSGRQLIPLSFDVGGQREQAAILEYYNEQQKKTERKIQREQNYLNNRQPDIENDSSESEEQNNDNNKAVPTKLCVSCNSRIPANYKSCPQCQVAMPMKSNKRTSQDSLDHNHIQTNSKSHKSNENTPTKKTKTNHDSTNEDSNATITIESKSGEVRHYTLDPMKSSNPPLNTIKSLNDPMGVARRLIYSLNSFEAVIDLVSTIAQMGKDRINQLSNEQDTQFQQIHQRNSRSS